MKDKKRFIRTNTIMIVVVSYLVSSYVDPVLGLAFSAWGLAWLIYSVYGRQGQFFPAGEQMLRDAEIKDVLGLEDEE